MKTACRMLTGVMLTIYFAALGGVPARSESGEIDDAAEAEQQLTEIRSQIEALEREITSQAAERGETEKALRKAERGESEVRLNLENIAADLVATEERLASLESESVAIRDRLAIHVGDLERQIRSAYYSGQDDWLRNILSQRDPAEIGRQLVYHSYIARERTELIDAVRADLDQLEQAETAAADQRVRLEAAQAIEREHLTELSALREQRKGALAGIDGAIATRNARIDRLRAEAEDLEALVAELTRILASIPIDGAVGFGERKGQMALPAAGRVIRKFGQSRADGHLRWEGILVGAPAGEEVRAVHYGRVVFSDWLPGMGLLVVVEHGDGYLSLYGHNQDLVSEVGEWVDPATVIAHVGDSGGQAAPGLYFEIRKDGAPQDPARWLAH